MIHPAQEALTLRAQLRSRYPGAMVRWDESGKGLLVSDAPRHGFSAGLDQAVALQRGLAFFDLPPEGYRLAVLRAGAPHAGAYRSGWLAEQAALAAVLAHPPQSEEGAGALVPEALAAIARGESPVRAAAARLRTAWACALRTHSPHARAACDARARLLAWWLWQEHGVGVPLAQGRDLVI